MRATQRVIITKVEPGKLTVEHLTTQQKEVIYDDAATAYHPGNILLIDRGTKEIADDVTTYPFN